MKLKLVLVALVVVMINLPFAHSTWQDRRLDNDGLERTATLVEAEETDADHILTFEVPESEGQPSFSDTARVDRAAYDAAVASGQVPIRVLPGSTTVWEVEGQVEDGNGLVITLIADAFLLVLVLLLLRFGSGLRQEMVLMATEDLERCPPGSVLDQIDGLRFVVCGEVETIEDDAVVLDLGDRRVRVLLAGHHNPAGYQQPVRATGTMVG